MNADNFSIAEESQLQSAAEAAATGHFVIDWSTIKLRVIPRSTEILGWTLSHSYSLC